MERFQLSINVEAREGGREGARKKERKDWRREGGKEGREEGRGQSIMEVVISLIQQSLFAHLLSGFKSPNSKML